MANIPNDIVMKWYHDTLVNPEPFNAVCNIIAMLKKTKEYDREYYYSKMDPYAKNIISLFEQFFFMPENIAKAKLVNIDKDLLPSILNTDNQIFYRNTGLPVMFINQDIVYGDYLIKGILISNTKELSAHISPEYLMELMITHPDVLPALDDLMIMFIYVDKSVDPYEENYVGYSLCGQSYTKAYGVDSKKLRKYISGIVCNIIDFMNHDTETIDINTIITTREENTKRIRRGKPPIPTKVYIRPKSEHRNYYISFNTELETRHLTHRFLVRGHWRHFRSDKWINRQGKSVWIKPYIKGKGIFIEKKYKLEGGGINDEEGRLA